MRLRDSSAPLKEYLWFFFARRALRIMPLYFGYVLLLTFCYALIRLPAPFPHAMPFLYTYTLNFARMMPGYVHSNYDPLWSLAIEWQFYMAWPFIVYFLPRKYLFPLLLLLIALAPLLRAITQVALAHAGFSTDQLSSISYNSTLTYVDAFALGGI